jgi:hypothetical protein
LSVGGFGVKQVQYTRGHSRNFFHSIFKSFKGPNHYARKPLPGPGSENIAFLTLALQRQTPIGAGNANLYQLIVEAPATYVPHVIGVQGVGGLLSGQFFGTPLFVQQPAAPTPEPVVIVPMAGAA